MMRVRAVAALICALGLLTPTCSKQPEQEVQPPEEAPVAQPRQVEVKLRPASGSGAEGTARFEPVDGGVRVVVEITGASPGRHGIHIHERADCSAPDATSAGGHFDPDDVPHGLPPASPRHLGDLGNIDIDEDGSGRLEIVVPGATLGPGQPRSLLGRAIVLHAQPDTGVQPAGGAGARIACGEILAPR